MTHARRLWLACLMLGGILLLGAAVLRLPSAPVVFAQAGMMAQPTSAPVATPAPALTPELPEAVKSWEGIKATFWSYGIWALLGLGLLWVLTQILPDLVKDALYGAGRRIAGMLGAASGRRSSIDAYFDAFIADYGQMPQIGVATEQVNLDVDEVHIPLRLAERAEAEAHQRRMRGERGDEIQADGSRQRILGELPSRRDRRVFKPLSEPDIVARRRREYERRLRFRRWLPWLRSENQRRYIGDDRVPPELIGPAEPIHAMLLLGGAGSGKTMTLRYAALRCIAAYRWRSAHALGDEIGLYLARPPLPIYARLTLFAQQLPADDERLPPSQRADLAGTGLDRFLDWLDRSSKTTLSEQVKRGGCLLLLDGLDEAGSDSRRAYLAELLDNLVRRYPQNRYVVASRTTGYGGRVQLGSFAEWHLAALEPEETRALLDKWFGAVYAKRAASRRAARSDDAESQSARLWDVVSRNARLLEMASNPLLATTMALLQFNNIRLPDQRAKLYEKLIELLLDLWRKTMVANDTMSSGVAQRATLQRRIERLALKMQLQPEQAREVTLGQAREWLAPLFRDQQGHSLPRETTDEAIERLLESLSIESGLIQRSQRTEQVYSFSHYTLQEYLAACGLDVLESHKPGASVAFLLQRSDDPRWHETLLLAAGEWSNRKTIDRASALLRGLLKKGSRAADVLAAEALADIGQMEELGALRSELAPRLHALAFDPAACPHARERNTAATLLDRLDADERPELDPADDAYWAARIEPGAFQMGPAPPWWREEKGERAFLARIRQPYRLARFPVTNALYKCFLDDLERRGEHEAWGQRKPFTWPGRGYRPGEGQHPVTGVTWRDAMAFAAWLDEDLRQRGILGRGERIRLPLETEWERAAAYPAAPPPGDPARGRREYPWGAWPTTGERGSNAELLAGLLNAQDERASSMPGPANTSESGIGGTSAVGTFPDGAAGCGAEDMAGNVWEWCATAAHSYPLPADLAPETLDTQTVIVLRGGSWGDDRSNAR
jgi:formylglycine-generating enzyme required for sulfatase activity